MKLSTQLVIMLITLLLFSCESEPTPIAIKIDNGQLYGARSMEVEEGETTPISFTIIYENDKIGLKELLSSYELQEERAFDIDNNMHAIEVSPRAQLLTPVEIGKIISMQENVLMVKVNNALSEVDTTS